MANPQPRCEDRLTSATDTLTALGCQTRHVSAREMQTSSELAGFSFALSAKLHLPENYTVSLPNSSRRSRGRGETPMGTGAAEGTTLPWRTGGEGSSCSSGA